MDMNVDWCSVFILTIIAYVVLAGAWAVAETFALAVG